MARYLMSVEVRTDAPLHRVRSFLSDALSIGCEQMDGDPENSVSGMLGEVEVTELPTWVD